jgi:TonB family protein
MRPPEPISGLVFLPKYRIRFDDGSELVIPSLDGLEQRVRRGEIRPDTIIFDAGRGIWCRAGEAPVVLSIVNEVGPEPLPGWSDENGRQATPALATVASDIPSRPAAAPVAPPSRFAGEPIRIADQPTRVTDQPTRIGDQPTYIADQPIRAVEPDRYAFDTAPAVASAGVFAIASRLPFPVTTRGRVAVTSVVGGASLLALGLVLFQGRDMSANDIMMLNPGSPPTTGPVAAGGTPELGSPGAETAAQAPSRGSTASRGIASVGATTDRSGPSARADRPRGLATPNPSIPQLTDLQISGDIDTSGSTINSSPIVALPVPSALGSTAGTSAPAASVTFTQAPRVLNASRVQQALEREYPIGLRALGVGGRVELSFYINEQGDVERYEVRQSSRNADLDRAALRVAQEFEFAPAVRGSERVATWFTFGINFGVGNNGITPAGANATGAAPSSAAAGATDQPVATRFDVAPRVSNATRVRQALEREYPNALRDSGIGGKVEVWFYVNEEGGVEAFQIKQSSNITALDQAALRVAQVFEFAPGAVGGQPAAGWVFVGITFNANSPGGTIR